MRLFRDLVSNDDEYYMDELFTDSKKIEEVPDCPALVRVPVKRVTVSNAISDDLIGGNASAEGEDAADAAQDGCITDIDLVVSHKLKAVNCFHNCAKKKEGIKDYKTLYFKKYFKEVTEKLNKAGKACEAAQFKENGPKLIQFIQDNWDNIAFYTGETCLSGDDPASLEHHSLCMMTFGDDGFEDYCYFIKYALIEEKV